MNPKKGATGQGGQEHVSERKFVDEFEEALKEDELHRVSRLYDLVDSGVRDSARIAGAVGSKAETKGDQDI